MLTKLTTLNEVATRLKINKSTLHYYVQLGLIKPTASAGKTFIFDHKEVMEKLKFIARQRENKMKLKDIKKKIEDKDNKPKP